MWNTLTSAQLQIPVTHAQQIKDAIQRERALARTGMTVDKLQTILDRQLPQAEKKARATYLFDTGIPIEKTVAMVEALVAAIKARRPKN